MIFLFVIIFVITIHELGHYLACRSLGIGVEKFGVGIGPRLFVRTDRRGTEWSLRLLPMAGFVQPNDDQMKSAAPWEKAYVAVAGPAINILPIAAFVALKEKSLDILGVLVEAYWSGMVAVGKIISVPFIWLSGFAETAAPGDPVGVQGVAGPIGMVSQGTDMSVLMMFFVTSLGLGLINLLPVPVLDGGRIVLAGFEQLAGTHRALAVEKVAQPVGVVMILIVFLVVTFSDVAKLI